MNVLIAGGSGLIGRRLAESLVKDGHEVVVLSRGGQTKTPTGVRLATWDARTADGDWVKELSGAQGLINLAGASIGSWPWTRRRMEALLASRLSATIALVQALERTPAGRRPSVLVNASGIDYYGDRVGDEIITEEGAPGDSFLARLSQQWEAAAQTAEPLGVRVVRIRTAMVFARDALAFRLLTLPFRLFAGGPLGNGRQWFTWIHLDDIVGLYRLALDDSRASGAINAVAPDVRREGEVAREIGRVMHRPALVPAPAFMLRLALRAQAQLLLDGRHATPTKAQALGYPFRFGGLRDALEDVIHRR